jgi:hypothetical protein
MTLDRDHKNSDDGKRRGFLGGLVTLRPRERPDHVEPKYPWLLPALVVSAVIVIIGCVVATFVLDIPFF